MKEQFILMVVERLVSLLLKNVDKQLLDKIFDAGEEAIEKSDNQYDDVILGLLIKHAREILDVPDDDDEEAFRKYKRAMGQSGEQL